MNRLENELRDVLHEMADEARSAPLMQRLEHTGLRRPAARRLTLVASASAVVVLALVAASLLALRGDQEGFVAPTIQPPRTFRLSDVTSTAPGKASMTVTFARANPGPGVDGGEHEDPLFVLPVDGERAVHLPGSRVPYSWVDDLSADGSRLIRQNEEQTRTLLELVDLATGQADGLGRRSGYCPRLSPDGFTVAMYSEPGIRVFRIGESTTRTLHPVDVTDEFLCDGGLGWSPNGDRLVARTDSGSVVLDLQGKVHRRWPGMFPVNDSMSWSPDGQRLLMYDRSAGGYRLMSLDGEAAAILRRPADGQRPIGWVGDRIVWLSGTPGDYRLVSTDQRGTRGRIWMSFDVGDRPIEAINWSADVSGRPAD
jgi:hypothetical protein